MRLAGCWVSQGPDPSTSLDVCIQLLADILSEIFALSIGVYKQGAQAVKNSMCTL